MGRVYRAPANCLSKCRLADKHCENDSGKNKFHLNFSLRYWFPIKWEIVWFFEVSLVELNVIEAERKNSKFTKINFYPFDVLRFSPESEEIAIKGRRLKESQSPIISVYEKCSYLSRAFIRQRYVILAIKPRLSSF